MARKTLLVIEDDPDIQELLFITLTKENYDVKQALNAEAGYKILRDTKIHLVLLDIMLPGMHGLDFLRTLHGEAVLEKTPVIIISAKGEESDIVSGLELGADDYIVKPFSPKVLAARIRAAFRRNEHKQAQSDSALCIQCEAGTLTIDKSKHKVVLNDAQVDMSATELAILQCLVKTRGRVFTRDQIIRAVKGSDYPVTDRSIDVQILAIRKKLGGFANLIETIRGIGYRCKDSP